MSPKTPIKLRRDYADCWFEDADCNILEDDVVLAFANAGARLPMTADGVPVLNGDVVYDRNGEPRDVYGGPSFAARGVCIESIGACYSTREAAEKARLA